MPRRNLGRQARKRRKKALEIEAVAFSLVRAATTVTTTDVAANTNANVNTNKVTTIKTMNNQDVEDNNVTNNSSILPTDRSYVSDDVKTRTKLLERDRIDLIRQLGYLPGNALQVVTRVKDVFSSEDIQRLFSAVVVTSTDDDESATSTSNGSISNGIRSSRITNNNSNSNSNNNMKSSSSKTKITAGIVQSMMDEPLVVKLYPLALRDESSSTKRRRKRRRDQKEEQQDDIKTTGDDEDTASKSKSIDTSLATASLLEPFPTIYWVTNPLVKVLISKLELDRLGSQFEQRLVEGGKEESKSVGQQQHEDDRDKHDNSEDTNNSNNNNSNAPSLTTPLEAMQRAHKSYGNERFQLLSTRDMDYVKQRRWDESAFSENCGVAGIRNPKSVKCLHAHAAHYWSGNSDNIVGRWVEERLKSGRFLFCSEGSNANKNITGKQQQRQEQETKTKTSGKLVSLPS